MIFLRRCRAAALTLIVTGMCATAASAAPVEPSPLLAQLVLPTTAPAGSAGIVQSGLYLTAPIVLDGATLFRIAAPLNAPAAQMPLAARAAQVQTALSQLLVEDSSGSKGEPLFDPQTLRVHTRAAGDAVVLEAVDAKHSDPLPIVTVTSVDARANGTSVAPLASEWQDTLQSALVRALILRQPAVERRSFRTVLTLALALIGVSLAVGAVVRALWRRMSELETEIGARAAEADTPSAIAPEAREADRRRRRWFALQLRNLKPASRLATYTATAETLLWGLAVAWFASATWSLSLFAQTTPLAQSIAHATLGVVTTVVASVLLSRLLDAVIARAAGAWRIRRAGSSEDRARSLLRIPTIVRALAGAKTFAIVFVAALSILGQIGVPIGSVVTIGGLAAIALSLAAQNFVRDFLNGFLVLLEDQYVVGDYVTINAFSGLVEALSLRMVQLRDAAGDVVTIPHSSVTSVLNQSRNWSRVDYRVPIDPNADVPRAIDIVRTQIVALQAHSDWTHGDAVPIEWIGIDAMSRDAIVIRASVRTAPLRQFELRRLINEHVLAALHAAGIGLGAPLPP